MTVKEKINWIGIKADDFTGSIDRFNEKMNQIGIAYESLPTMSDDFMKLYNICENEQDKNTIAYGVSCRMK